MMISYGISQKEKPIKVKSIYEKLAPVRIKMYKVEQLKM